MPLLKTASPKSPASLHRANVPAVKLANRAHLPAAERRDVCRAYRGTATRDLQTARPPVASENAEGLQPRATLPRFVSFNGELGGEGSTCYLQESCVVQVFSRTLTACCRLPRCRVY